MTARAPKVLVVDDEPVIHELVGEVLHAHEVVSAMTVAEAQTMLAADREIAVAIVDKNLPDRSGLELVAWLRASGHDCEAIILTGYPSMSSALEAMSAGATDYLVKPMRDINDLRLRVGNACARVDGRRAERRLVAELRASEARYRELFEATVDAVVVSDDDTGAIVDANRAAEALYGRSRAELATLRTADLRADGAAGAVDRVGDVLVRRDRRANGQVVPVEVTAGTMWRDRRLAIEIVRDVSERLRLESRLSAAARLEATGRLAAGVAHDFNNVLCVIGGCTEFAEQALADGKLAEARDELAQIHTAIANASSLTRQLLVFSRQSPVSPQRLELDARLPQSAALLVRTLGKRTRVVLDLAAPGAHVVIDPGQLEQIVANLVVNARDALGERAGTIAIATRPRADAGGRGGVALTVSDDGPGIAPDVLGTIFEPFVTTKGDRGTGLGLANVHDIATRAGGTVDVASTVGAGATFTIWLPLSAGPTAVTTMLPRTRSDSRSSPAEPT